jgi:outer membrane lipoprotein carrier protein
MNKNRKSLISKFAIFAIFVAILIGKLLFAAFLLFTAKNALAAPPVASDELAQLLNNIRIMQATFEQYLINNQNTIIGAKTKGKMKLMRPGKFRCEITEPNKQLILINQNDHWVYDADLEQLVKHRANYHNSLNPAMLLSSRLDTLKKLFTIIRLRTRSRTSNKERWFKLTPKTPENSYQWIKIHFVSGKLDKMQIVDNLGQKSVINFNNLILNTPLTPKIFTFTPPSDTDVFEAE